MVPYHGCLVFRLFFEVIKMLWAQMGKPIVNLSLLG